MKLAPGARPAAPLTLRSRFTLDLEDGTRAFVKVTERSKQMRLNFRNEALCLDRLEGLAVPRLVRIDRKDIEALFGGIPCEYIAQEFVQGTPFIGRGLRPSFVMGAWCFFVEQLCAIRRVGIVYTDVKVTNLILRKNAPRLTIIDFGNAQAVEARGHYSNYEIHYTAGFEAPEQTSAKYLTEASFVYQLGMALAYALAGLNNLNLRNGKAGYARLEKTVRAGGTEELHGLVLACLEEDPKKRPRTYERVLARLDALKREGRLGEAVVAAWKSLREPYDSILKDVDLRWKT